MTTIISILWKTDKFIYIIQPTFSYERSRFRNYHWENFKHGDVIYDDNGQPEYIFDNIREDNVVTFVTLRLSQSSTENTITKLLEN